MRDRLTYRESGIVWGAFGVDINKLPDKQYDLSKKLFEYEETGCSPADVVMLKQLHDNTVKKSECQAWIPAAERLPELGLTNPVTGEYQEYICYMDFGDGVYDIRTLMYSSCGMWLRGRMDYHPDSVIAWMPLPEPYKP